jgi:Flp pilus assembly CpaF family ATPase
VRRHRFPSITLDDLVGLGTIDDGLKAFLLALVAAGKNIVIGGETGAGKTTLLRALVAACPPEERLVTVENAFELNLHRDPEAHRDVVAFQAREANAEGEGAVSMAALVRRTLRHNPDRVIVGEVLGDEVVPMLLAMTQGNDGSLSTIHARSSEAVFTRIGTYALLSPERLRFEESAPLVAGAIDYAVFLVKRDEDGLPAGRVERFVSSVREVIGFDGALVASNEVYAPGPDRRAVPAAPMRHLDDLVRVGFDTSWLDKPDGWWWS